MYIVFQKFIDILFPPSHEALIVRELTPSNMREMYTLRKDSEIHSLSSYSSPLIRAVIHEAKFHNNKLAFILLNVLFGEYIKMHGHTVDVIIPIPLSRKRLVSRGYNQVYESICNNYMSQKIDTSILVRTKHTQPQTTLEKAERLQNVRNAFQTQDATKINQKHILIVDDVTTTGATLREAKATLLPHGPASITCVAFAH